ncbi:MAG: hypothetical protein WCA84_08405 [Ignavibacteriaceae bacterium]
MEEITNMMDSMNVALKKNLNNEQISSLSEEMQRMKKNPRQPLPPPGKKT